ncbi:MAG: CAP domain-containing protein, partial [Actinomycetota bacterium]
MSWLRRVATTTMMAGLCLAASPIAASASTPNPPFIMPNAGALTAVNYFRAMAGLPAVTENSTWSAADKNHSTWMLYNGIAHYETPGTAFYTASGDEAGKTGNVAVSSDINATARSHVELWMTGPFHAIGILRYNLASVGFGMATSTTSPRWHSAATLDVIHGLTQGTA